MSVVFSTDDYIVPEWSHMPKYAYHLQVIKEGSIVGNINLKKKQFILVGRLADLCDLSIDNQSVSRKHAIIQFKNNDDYPYIYDLGGTHGTEVNRKKLPSRAYQKLRPYDMIKFGLSTRYYVMRCPELEQKEKQQQNEADNKFQQILAQKNKQLSKQQFKDKYLQMLENDPYFKANNLSKKLEGKEANRDINGVDWGISDQYEVYSYRNQSQLQLEPDILRRMPGLDQIQLNRISEYQTNFNKYQQIESELNELSNKEKREYGLQEKLRDKKQKLQKRFVQALEALEKSEDWIRVNIFGEKQMKVAKRQKAQKQDDTFQNDQFFDRTLKAKNLQKQQSLEQKLKQQQGTQMFTTQDFWKLEKQLRSQLKTLISLQRQQRGKQQQLQQDNHSQPQQQDQLDAYMKQNNEDLLKQQMTINEKRIEESSRKIRELKDYLLPLIGINQIKKIQDEERGIQTSNNHISNDSLNKQKQAKNKITETLNKLEIIREMEEDVDEEDVNIFNYYKGNQNQEDQAEGYARHQKSKNRPRNDTLDREARVYEEPPRKLGPSLIQQSRDKQGQQEDEQCHDLTKLI